MRPEGSDEQKPAPESSPEGAAGPASKGPATPIPTAADAPTPARAPKSSDGMHRILWERSRVGRSAEILLMQLFLWSGLFSFRRGAFVGVDVIIPLVISIILITYVLISVTKFGSLFDIVLMLGHALLLLTATFSILYWNYGTTRNFTAVLTRLDAVYFTVGTLTTREGFKHCKWPSTLFSSYSSPRW
jgi:hypothetical protein